MVYNGYYKVMSNSPKMGHLPIPVIFEGTSRVIIVNASAHAPQKNGFTIVWLHGSPKKKPKNKKVTRCKKKTPSWITLLFLIFNEFYLSLSLSQSTPEAGLRKVLPMAGGFKVILHLLLVLLGDFTAGEDAAIGRETLPENSVRANSWRKKIRI